MMSESSNKAVLIESEHSFNMEGMKLFRFHASSCADFFYVHELSDASEKFLCFIFCSTGKIRISLGNGQTVYARQQEIACVSEKFCISLSETEKETTGFLLVVEIPKIQNSFLVITKIMGNWNLDTRLALRYAEKMNGEFLIKGNPWVFSLFSVLNMLDDDTEQDCYCVWKCIELLYLLSQKMVQVQQKGMFQKNSSVHDRLKNVCSYMELHLDEKMTIHSLCRKFYLSPTTFKKYFHSIYDRSVHSWLLQKRMEKAAELLYYTSIMDGPPALTLGLEPNYKDLMKRKPTRREESIISKAMLWRIGLTGAYISIVFLCQYLFNFLGAASSEQATVLFTLFVLFQLFNSFNCREFHSESILKHLLRNKIMLWVVGGTFVLQIVFIQFAGAFFFRNGSTGNRYVGQAVRNII